MEPFEIPLEIPYRRRLLIAAACHVDSGQAADAWTELVEDCGSTGETLAWINSGSERRILPLLHPRLDVLGLGKRLPAETDDRDQAELVEEVTESVVESWALNERLLMATRPTLELLLAEGVDLLCIKGIALVGDVYPEHRLRPIGDLDVLVRPGHRRRAFGLLRDAGWRPPLGSRFALPGMAAINVSLHDGASIDMHQRPARDLPHRAGREPFCWADGRPLPPRNPLADLALLRPSTTDHLLVLAAHVMRATNGHLAHPLADVHRVLEAAANGRTDAVDIDRLVEVSRGQFASLRMATVLDTVHRLTGVAVPPLDDLWRVSTRHRRLERRVVAADARGTSDDTGARATIAHAWYGVRAATIGQGPRSKMQVSVAAMVAWIDLRLGRLQWRRRTPRANSRRTSGR